MGRVLLLDLDNAELISSAIELHGINDVFVALDESPSNRRLCKAAGLGRYACVGSKVDRTAYELMQAPSPAPKPKRKSKKAEVVVDEPTEEVQS